jgi:hypothetical protein
MATDYFDGSAAERHDEATAELTSPAEDQSDLLAELPRLELVPVLWPPSLD